MAALMIPEIGTVTNQAMKMFLNRRQSTDFLERSHPTATTDPTCVEERVHASIGSNCKPTFDYRSPSLRVLSAVTLQCVVLTGSPTLDATTTVSADANSMLNPLFRKKTR